MSGSGLLRIFTLTKCINTSTLLGTAQTSHSRTQICGYAKKVVVKGRNKGMVIEEKKGPEVCKDPVRLTSYAVGVNIYKEGEDPKLKPPEEYPEWLFQLKLGKPSKLHELDPDTWEYWKRLRKENIWRHNRLHRGKSF
ncbi:S ribosomal protein L54%2C mitochondrial [Xyrichtys novacula]|uniref:Large ribosomal subunit protein mL54 n=1 Tax=Xyrichtys novacula TaxID=13765 RepID=A0AAV1FGE5_XYRNO|nr:S ribosomal protein L54%2C mitochondrial [Xyrichtys novacula]